MKKKIIGIGISVIVLILVVWCVMVITDYNRAKDMKAPLFAYSKHLDQHGGGIYECLGYDVWAMTKDFNGKDHVLYDMHFMMFGRGKHPKFTIGTVHNNCYLLLGDNKETISNYIEALKYITPTKVGEEELYSEHAHINGEKIILNLNFYKDILTGFDYEYDNLKKAYEDAVRLRENLELTFGEKTTYPNVVQANKVFFDNLKSASDLKTNFTYYEDWTVGFDYNKKDNIEKMMKDKKYSRTDIRFELKVVNENKAILSTHIIAVP